MLSRQWSRRTTRSSDRSAGRVARREVPQNLESSLFDLGRIYEGDTLRRRDRCGQRPQEWRASVIDFPANQHGVIFVYGIVAVLHEHAAPVTELHGQGHAAARTQTIDVFTAFFPCRNVAGAAVPGQNLAFLKVNVNRMIPAAAAILQRPDFTRAELGCSRDAAEIGLLHAGTIGLNAPLACTGVRSGRINGGLLGAAAEGEVARC